MDRHSESDAMPEEHGDLRPGAFPFPTAHPPFEDYLAERASVVVGLERPGPLSATEVLATLGWFKRR